MDFNSRSKYLFPITPRTNPGLAVVTRNGFIALGVLRPNAQNLTRRGDQSESKDSISSAPEFLKVKAKQGEMPLFFMAVGGRGAARATKIYQNIFNQSEPWHFSANPTLGTFRSTAPDFERWSIRAQRFWAVKYFGSIRAQRLLAEYLTILNIKVDILPPLLG